jgi:hypothetical protein
MLMSAALIELRSDEMSDRNLRFGDQLAENIIFLAVRVINSRLNITAFNSGGSALHIVSVWATNETTTPMWHKGFSVSNWISAGGIRSGIGITTGTYSPSNIYTITLVTERGSRFETTYSPSGAMVASVQGFGWLTIDWESYVYYWREGSGAHSGGPHPGWCSPQLPPGYYQWQVSTINHYNQSVYLVSWSYLKLQSNGGADQPFYIMGPASTPQVPVAYSSQIELPANPSDRQTGGTPVTLKFMANTPGTTSRSNVPNGYYSVVLLLFYQWTDIHGTHTVGQTIPYEGTFIYDNLGCPPVY